jgi:putative sterol carrier protein
MAHRFPSEEWIQAWHRTVNRDDVYRRAGAGWGVDFDGNVLFHLQADDRLPEDRYFSVRLDDDAVDDCREVDAPDSTDHGLVLRGSYADWVRLTTGEIGAAEGLMTGVFELEGDVQGIVGSGHSTAAARLVELLAEVDTEYAY